MSDVVSRIRAENTKLRKVVQMAAQLNSETTVMETFKLRTAARKVLSELEDGEESGHDQNKTAG